MPGLALFEIRQGTEQPGSVEYTAKAVSVGVSSRPMRVTLRPPTALLKKSPILLLGRALLSLTSSNSERAATNGKAVEGK